MCSNALLVLLASLVRGLKRALATGPAGTGTPYGDLAGRPEHLASGSAQPMQVEGDVNRRSWAL